MPQFSVEERARISDGSSSTAIQGAVASVLRRRRVHAQTLIDVGCGNGHLSEHLRGMYARYIGADAIRHDGFPEGLDFVRANLDAGTVALPEASGDVVACVETIEHVENPRGLIRELTRLACPGGWLVITTPNQLSLLSKIGLLLKNEFVHFQERPGLYPAHISALLEVDLVRMCRENLLEEIEVTYTGSGRVPLTRLEWPHPLQSHSGLRGRAFSDNVIVVARKPLKPLSAE